MKEISERKRGKQTGRGGTKSYFVQLFHSVVDSPQWHALDSTAMKFLIALARQYNGKNNGDLAPSLCLKWKSADTRTRAVKKLQEGGWIVKTKQGGMGIGPDLYAITWFPINACKPWLTEERVASNAWSTVTPEVSTRKIPENKKSPFRLTESIAPSNGTGNRKKEEISTIPVPSNGPLKPFSEAA